MFQVLLDPSLLASVIITIKEYPIMNTQEYTLVTNRVNISRALNALGDVTSTGSLEGITPENLKKVRFILSCAEQRLFKMINLEGEL